MAWAWNGALGCIEGSRSTVGVGAESGSTLSVAGCAVDFGFAENVEKELSWGFGFAGKVEKGPSWVDRLLGGRPRSFPVEGFPLLGHADDTAGPCRRRALLLLPDAEGMMAD